METVPKTENWLTAADCARRIGLSARRFAYMSSTG